MSKIEWTERTWNPITGCTRVSEGSAEHVVAADESTWPAVGIEASEHRSAPTLAGNDRIRLSLLSEARILGSVFCKVGSHRGFHVDILGTIVELVAVDVVHDLARNQKATELLTRHKAVFVDISTSVRQWMARLLDQVVAAGSERPTTLPIRVPFSWMNDSHALRIARSTP